MAYLEWFLNSLRKNISVPSSVYKRFGGMEQAEEAFSEMVKKYPACSYGCCIKTDPEARAGEIDILKQYYTVI